MHEEMHGGGRVVPSMMVAENGAIGFAGNIVAAIVVASHSGREPRHWKKEGGATFLR